MILAFGILIIILQIQYQGKNNLIVKPDLGSEILIFSESSCSGAYSMSSNNMRDYATVVYEGQNVFCNLIQTE